ncbi:hypothetical protein D1BOALGB6SA_5021 [Olavius sp. associated proteobacterium Delta 1]|nr:hypothetical protein D1BOALGB6SA_5021 [Olavius sp. associated proteobacterium Delta 1]
MINELYRNTKHQKTNLKQIPITQIQNSNRLSLIFIITLPGC